MWRRHGGRPHLLHRSGRWRAPPDQRAGDNRRERRAEACRGLRARPCARGSRWRCEWRGGRQPVAARGGGRGRRRRHAHRSRAGDDATAAQGRLLGQQRRLWLERAEQQRRRHDLWLGRQELKHRRARVGSVVTRSFDALIDLLQWARVGAALARTEFASRALRRGPPSGSARARARRACSVGDRWKRLRCCMRPLRRAASVGPATLPAAHSPSAHPPPIRALPRAGRAARPTARECAKRATARMRPWQLAPTASWAGPHAGTPAAGAARTAAMWAARRRRRRG